MPDHRSCANLDAVDYGIESVPRSGFIRASLWFLLSALLAGCCSIVRSLFVAKWLGPQSFGTWKFVNIFLDYARYASLGVGPAMARIVPYLRGRGDLDRMNVTLHTIVVTNLVVAVIYSAAVFGISCLIAQPEEARALAAFAPVICLVAWLKFSHRLSMVTGRYALRSRMERLHALLTLLLTVTFVYFWDLYGAIAGVGCAAILSLCMYTPMLWRHFALTVNWRILLGLMGVGLPILINGVLVTTMANIDKILIAAMLSRDDLGIYCVGNAGLVVLGAIPTSLGGMLAVKFAEMDGQDKSDKHMLSVLDRTTMVIAALLAPMLVVGIALFPIAVVLLLPEYVGGIDAGRLLIAGLMFAGVATPARNWCISTGRYTPILMLRLFVLSVEAAAIYYVIRHGARLEHIALSVLSAMAMFGIFAVALCNLLLGQSCVRSMTRGLKDGLPFLSILTVLVVQDLAYPLEEYAAVSRLYISSGLAAAAGLAMSAPFIYQVNRRVGLVDILRDALSRRR